MVAHCGWHQRLQLRDDRAVQPVETEPLHNIFDQRPLARAVRCCCMLQDWKSSWAIGKGESCCFLMEPPDRCRAKTRQTRSRTHRRMGVRPGVHQLLTRVTGQSEGSLDHA